MQSPADPFTILELQNTSQDVAELHEISPSPDFETARRTVSATFVSQLKESGIQKNRKNIKLAGLDESCLDFLDIAWTVSR